jgi:hypothetical protein
VKYRVVLLLDVLMDIHNASKIYAGLHLLARRGLVSLQIHPARGHSDVQFAQVTAPGEARPRWVAFDTSDHSDFFFTEALGRCDVYFKRSYYGPHLDRLPAGDRGKVLPFGLNYPCAAPGTKSLIVRHWLAAAAGLCRRSPGLAARRGRDLLRYLRTYLAQLDFRLFEQPPDAPVVPRVLFQTRLWEPEKSDDDLAQVNEERVRLIRALRKALGERFHGGVVPTPFARRHYPDVLEERTYRRQDFLRMMQASLVGVYTRGLHHSLAFKLPEYLAASMCVVSEPLRNPLPQPLVPGAHYQEFRDAEECVARCERLLSRPAEAREMRRANHDYYRCWVAPAEHLWNCLRAACALG